MVSADARRCVTGNDQRIEAHCASGDVFVDNQPRNNLTTRVATADSAAIHPPIWAATAERYSSSFKNQITELANACLGNTSGQVGSTVEEGYWASRTVRAAITSWRERRMVDV